MLTDLCQEIHNWFDYDRVYGDFEITGGELTASFLQEGQYFRICGSVFNDGVWQYGVDALKDEAFTGSVWALAIPPAVIALNDEIDNWIESYGASAVGPYSSESFGGYSYTKASSGSGSDASTWQGAFRSRLNQWRKI